MADFIVWDADHPVEMVYEPGRNPLYQRIFRGGSMSWQPVAKTVWQGRDDSTEASNAKRIFQTIRQPSQFTPVSSAIALIGFACDEGVRRNQGRQGAAQAPDVLRKALANMATHSGHERLVDMGSVYVEDDQLEEGQQALSDAVVTCQQAGMRTLVLGGGHETAGPTAVVSLRRSRMSAWRSSTGCAS